jgi:hypothetical protein
MLTGLGGALWACFHVQRPSVKHDQNTTKGVRSGGRVVSPERMQCAPDPVPIDAAAAVLIVHPSAPSPPHFVRCNLQLQRVTTVAK